MDKNYEPINLDDILPKIDSSKIDEFLNAYTSEKKTSIETIDYLLNSLAIEKESIKYENTFIRNYIYVSLITRRHLLEIEERIKEIKKQANKINDKESYAFRKLKYFLKKNEKAKNEIVDFFCYKIDNYLSKHSNSIYDLINREQDEKLWALYGPAYDYNYNYMYYDPNYDFSTYVKFIETPNVGVIDSLKNVESTIDLKENNPEVYYEKVMRTVDDNCLLQNMAERVEKNYHFHKRKEIFQTMATLFSEEKYTTFIITATIQIEGMFFELVSIRYGGKENQGTLVEKADKTFSKNAQQKHTLYPYFAFDIPELRNKVAHIGLVDNDNIKTLAYELVLDLHCILTLAEKESLDKFRNMMLIFSKLNIIKKEDYEEEYEYMKAVATQLYYELYMGNLLTDEYFWNLITQPTDYDEELNYYLPEQEDEDYIYLKDVVYYIYSIVTHKLFWEVVLEICDEFSEINRSSINDLGAFTEKLKNMFIPRLSGDAKDLCVAVNKKLQGKRIIN